jgi:hypothetical protein
MQQVRGAEDSQRSAARLWWRAGFRLRQGSGGRGAWPVFLVRACPPKRASAKAGGGGAPLGATRESCLLAEAGVLASTPRLAALHGGLFRNRATLSNWHSRHGQPAPGRGAVVRPGWSPGSPEGGMPAARGSRVTRGSLSRPHARKYQGRISGPFLRPAPLSRRLMSAPLGEQGAGIIGEVFRAGINCGITTV